MDNKVILVLEDEKPLLEAIRINLEKSNFKVIKARTVEKAKECINELDQLDLIWLDHYLLGKENGLDFIAWCKEGENAKCNNVPIFVVSNTISDEKFSTYMSLGAKKYFIKSNFKLEEIIKEINEALLID